MLDRAALVFGERTTKYEQLHHDVARFAQGLIESGVEVGDRVAILGLNSDRAIVAFFAAQWAGAIRLFANFRWTRDELVVALEDCEAIALVFDEQFAASAVELAEKCESLRCFVSMGARESLEGPANAVSMNVLIADNEGIALSVRISCNGMCIIDQVVVTFDRSAWQAETLVPET